MKGEAVALGNRAGLRGYVGYEYDEEDRLVEAEASAAPAWFIYDWQGERVVSGVGEGVTPERFHYNRYFETTADGFMTKYYYLGDTLVASRRLTAPAGTASIADRAVQVVQVPGEYGVALALRRDFRLGLACSVVLATTVLLALPGRRRRAAGLGVSRGQVALAALAFACGTLPTPILLLPLEGRAWASGGGPSGPSPTPVVPPPTFVHYHLDHQGSTQVITDATGALAQEIRYTAYGEQNAHYDGAGNWTGHSYRREFTGYQPESNTGGLLYAGARFYDPGLGMFLTHDPARQFSSPYTYGNGDPVNGTDPSGMWWEVIGIAFLIGFATASIQAAVNGASAGESLKAGAIAGGIGAATSALLGPLIGPGGWTWQISPSVGATFSLASVGAGAYSTYQSIDSGQYVAGGVGAVLVAMGAYGLAKGMAGAANDAPGGKSAVRRTRGGATNTAALTDSEVAAMRQETADRIGVLKYKAQIRGVTETTQAFQEFESSVGAGEFTFEPDLEHWGDCTPCGPIRETPLRHVVDFFYGGPEIRIGPANFRTVDPFRFEETVRHELGHFVNHHSEEAANAFATSQLNRLR